MGSWSFEHANWQAVSALTLTLTLTLALTLTLTLTLALALALSLTLTLALTRTLTWQAVSAEAKAIVASMLQVNPARRATAAVVLRSAWLLRHGRVGRALMGPGNALSPSQGDRQRRVHTDASAGTSLAASIKALRRTTTRRTTRRTSGPS